MAMDRVTTDVFALTESLPRHAATFVARLRHGFSQAEEHSASTLFYADDCMFYVNSDFECKNNYFCTDTLKICN